MRRWTAALVVSGLAVVAGCHRPGAQQTAGASAAQQIAWREGDVDDAFAEAKESGKPVLLYWGAKWYPPCNMMKQTLFKDAGFIAETRNFVPVHLDGDDKGAQLWGEKFGIAGYPTVIILRPDHAEVTRLSGGSAAASLTQVLQLAAKRTVSTEELLKRARDPQRLSKDDWALLANYDWMDDPRHFKDANEAATVTERLAQAAPDAAVRRQLALTSLVLATGAADGTKLTLAQATALRETLPAMLSNYAETRASRQMLEYAGGPLILGLPDKAEQQRLGAALVAALDRVAADPTVPLGDRVESVMPDIALSKAAHGGQVAPAVLVKVRQRVALADRAADNPMLRQAVMPNAGDLLDQAGDHAGAAKLLEGELPHAIAPYYFMIDLADLAESRKDYGTAITWGRRAAETAEGPASRVQWAIMYSGIVRRLAPTDLKQVEQSAGMVIDALGQDTGGYAERTARKIGKWGGEMQAWSKANHGRAVLERLNVRLGAACAKGRAGPACGKALTTA